MSTKYKISDHTKLYFVTFTVIQWIDVFTRKLYKDLLVENIKYCQSNKGLELYAWVLMSNHIHMIIGSQSVELSNIIRDLKKYTSVKLLEAIKENTSESRKDWMITLFESAGRSNSNNYRHQFWIQNNHPIELSTNEMMEQRLDYIHDNPVRAGIVLSPDEYLYSSAKNYYGKKDYLLELMLLE